MASNAGLLEPPLKLEGVVSGYVEGQQEGDQVIKFIVEPEEGDPLAVVMRGTRIDGVIRDGHRVALVAPKDFHTLEDKTLRPLKLRNETTHGIVSSWSPGFRRKAMLAGIGTFKGAWLTFVGITVAALFALATSLVGFSDDAGFAPPDFEPSSSSIVELVVMELVWLGIAAVLSYLFFIANGAGEAGRSQCPSRPSSPGW